METLLACGVAFLVYAAMCVEDRLVTLTKAVAALRNDVARLEPPRAALLGGDDAAGADAGAETDALPQGKRRRRRRRNRRVATPPAAPSAPSA